MIVVETPNCIQIILPLKQMSMPFQPTFITYIPSVKVLVAFDLFILKFFR